MIIKIMKSNEFGFWMLDNVDTIEVERFPYSDGQGYPSHTYKNQEFFGEMGENIPKTDAILINYKDKYGDWCAAGVRGTTVYICNDKGQTVERICV